jgi:hypothetical protein
VKRKLRLVPRERDVLRYPHGTTLGLARAITVFIDISISGETLVTTTVLVVVPVAVALEAGARQDRGLRRVLKIHRVRQSWWVA